MIAEVLLVLAGHSSSLFPTDHTVNPAFAPLLHPGEKQCLESLGLIACRYRKIKAVCTALASSPSRYICALCAALSHILKDEYEALVVDTEAKILSRDEELVANGSFVPLSSVRAIFSEWDAPLAALSVLADDLSAEKNWKPGPLIDLLLARSSTGVHRIANILSQLSVAVQRVWRTQLTAFIVHGSLSTSDPIASDNYILVEESIPSCVSVHSRQSITYVGRALATVKAAKWQKQLPRDIAASHTSLLESVLPEDQHSFDLVISKIRTNVSEWLWSNVLTQKDIEDAVESLGNYFLLRNGEFSLSLIREIERLKLSRLTAMSGPSTMIREQDLNLAILRASLGTTAQHDPALSRLRFSLPSGPIRPLLPSLANVQPAVSFSASAHDTGQLDHSLFSTHLLGTQLLLSYNISWPLDLFLEPADLAAYGALFSFLSALRKTRTRVHTCWTSLSNAQRARRRWTGLGEGGTDEDSGDRIRLLRCGWGIVRDMGWFLDMMLGYLMMDVVDTEFRKLREVLAKGLDVNQGGRPHSSSVAGKNPALDNASYLDFTTLHTIHTAYLDRLLTGCLLTNSNLTAILRIILDVCDQFVAQVERWGGDVLPALLFEGSLGSGLEEVGAMVRERWRVVAGIDQTLRGLLESFYEQLTSSISQHPFSSAKDASKSIFLSGAATHTMHNMSKTMKGIDVGGESRRHVERLLLRLDFNGAISKLRQRSKDGEDILVEGGLS